VGSKLHGWCLALGFLAVLLPGGAAHAQLAHLVKDLNTTNAHALGYGYMPTPVLAGTNLFFTADDGGSGNELWKLDTTTGTATRVKDVCPGPCSSSPLWLTALGNLVLFLAEDGVHGYELWRSDGTDGGTFLLRDLIPGDLSGNAGLGFGMTALGGRILFFGRDPLLGVGLWSTDGTRAGTQLVTQISAGNGGAITLLAGGGRLLFAGDDGVHGEEPWISDGTAAGTHPIRDLNPGSGSSLTLSSSGVAAALPDGSFVFAADDGTHGVELWRTDGTEAGTALVQDLNTGAPGTDLEGFVPLGGKVYFTATTSTGWGLWGTDGTPAGTAQVANIAMGKPFITRPRMARAGNRLYFPSGTFSTLWTSDGTAAGTQSLPVGPTLAIGGLGNSGMILAGGAFSDQLRLWKTDGTPAGTVQVMGLGASSCSSYPFPPGPELNGELYFYQCLSSTMGGPFWKTDGTQAGTVQVQAPVRTSSFRPMFSTTLEDFFSPLGGGLFFSANDGVSGLQVWHTDGSAAGTQPVIGSVSPFSFARPTPLGSSLVYVEGGAWRMDADGSATDLGVSGASDYPVQRAGNQAFFSVYNGSGYDLWKTDGTAPGTGAVPGTTFPFNLNLKGSAGSVVLFEKNTAELWRSDGTGPGTFILSPPPILSPAFSMGSEAFFPSWDNNGDWMLWKTDGTIAGTVPVRTFFEAPPYSGGGPSPLTSAGGLLFFTFTDPTHGSGLWASDGTDAGTRFLKSFLSGIAGYSAIYSPIPLGSRIFFTADDGTHGIELWTSDGTDAGTHLVKDISPGPLSSAIPYLVAAGGRLFFTADDGTHGIELWTSDGTDAGTHLVKDILPGADSSLPVNLAAVGRHVVLTATDGVHGSEPWVSDGTDAGTFLLQDVAPGAASSGPLSYSIGASKAFFVADDGATGAELWTVPRRALDPTFTDVPSTFWAWRFIESLAASGVTGGCGDGDFCPGAFVNRAQMAVFVLTARGTAPPPATGTRFDDVPPGYWAGPWIEELAREGVVGGCSANPPLYCPGNLLTRAEMAVLLTLARHETPPPATGTRFTDVPADYWAARFIEQLATDGVTSGCGGGNFCPDQPITRGEMAVFLATAFHLPLP
jgi:ELWxxDGT repeat protein